MTTSISRSFKGRTVLYGVGIFLIFSIIYLYQTNQEEFHQLKRSKQKCIIEQESLSSQLQVVTDFKVRIEKSLNAERSEHARIIAAARTNQQEERDTLQQSLSLLQSQFDDLTLDCNKVRDSGNGDRENLKKYKNIYSDIKSANEKLQIQLDMKSHENSKLMIELDNIKQENILLMKNIQLLSKKSRPQSSFYLPELKNNKNISKQIKVSDDVYIVNIGSNNQTAEGIFNKYSEGLKNNLGPLDVKSSPNDMGVLNMISSSVGNFTKQSTKISSTSETIVKEKLRPQIPNGVAPEIIVDDNLNSKISDRNKNKYNSIIAEHQNEIEDKNTNIPQPPDRYDAKLPHKNNDVDDNENNNIPAPLEENKENLISNKRNFNDETLKFIGNSNGELDKKDKAFQHEVARPNDENDFNDDNISRDKAESDLQNGPEEDDDDVEEEIEDGHIDQAPLNKN